MLAVWRRWRPVLFVALTMFGELSLFLASAAAVDRAAPAGEEPGRADAHLVLPLGAHRGHALRLDRDHPDRLSAYRPSIESEDVRSPDDELAKAARVE